MTRAALLLLIGLSGCSSAADDAPVSANKTAEIDALARNLSAQADAWRDDTDNQEAAAEAQAASDNASTDAAAAMTVGNRP